MDQQPNTKRPKTMTTIDNFINNKPTPPSTPSYLPIITPFTSTEIGKVAISTPTDVQTAIKAAKSAFPAWSTRTIKSRASILLRFHSLIQTHSQELAECIVRENGKNMAEALAEVAKGNETVEYACSLPQLSQGKILQVSSDVACQDRRDALGVVACIVPFNFPMMVPMWTIPIAVMMGNCVILKPSEKVPMTMMKVAMLMKEAGVPDGVFGMVQGKKEVVDALIEHDDVRAITFVGSSPVASYIYNHSQSHNKRCIALGGAKNHLIALPDAHIPTTASDVVVSFAGCAGQRCMAASVLLIVGENQPLLEKVVENASKIEPGKEAGRMGPVIDEMSYKKIMKYINEAETNGAKVLLDGRTWSNNNKNGCTKGGYWIGPTILHFSNKNDPAMTEEIFGPVLSVYNCSNWNEALEIENSNPFGNAASIYTTVGAHADYFTKRFRAAMLGVNIGIPVPREPFSFGGLYGTKSKFGVGDITGEGAMEFFSERVKVTAKWPKVELVEDGNKGGGMELDKASFVGSM